MYLQNASKSLFPFHTPEPEIDALHTKRLFFLTIILHLDRFFLGGVF